MPALSRVALARHTRTRSGWGLGGPLGHAGALFPAVHEENPFRDHPKLNNVKVAILGKLEESFFFDGRWWLRRAASSVYATQMRSGALDLRLRQTYH